MAADTHHNNAYNYDDHYSAPMGTNHTITGSNSPTAIHAAGMDYHLGPEHHPISYTTNACRSPIFPNGRHVVRPASRTTTSVQPILILLPRHVSPNTATKQQQSRHIGVGDALAHHGTNGIKLTVILISACIPHTCSVCATNARKLPWVPFQI
ncbi:unnamed protein product [Lactuca saligna]|uniref:Uncharacterized protein n=1 Tax=Lactuca saligna TaxID=75948 RepID=A0AA35ZCA5_LACSI|nr:unnamed protein product [Lactuca saligna]